MGIEIERRFLVQGSAWRKGNGVRITQGYLCWEEGRIVRVRLAAGRAFLTIKGPSHQGAKPEFEYEIPAPDGEQMLLLCQGALIEKIRRQALYRGFPWEVDEFLGENSGLVVAEIELNDVTQGFERPAWLGEEITGDPRYTNARLSITPYHRWRDRVSPSG